MVWPPPATEESRPMPNRPSDKAKHLVFNAFLGAISKSAEDWHRAQGELLDYIARLEASARSDPRDVST